MTFCENLATLLVARTLPVAQLKELFGGVKPSGRTWSKFAAVCV